MEIQALIDYLTKRPEALMNRRQIYSVLCDLAGGGGAEVNLMMNAFDTGIVGSIYEHFPLEGFDRTAAVSKITLNYVIPEPAASNAVSAWQLLLTPSVLNSLDKLYCSREKGRQARVFDGSGAIYPELPENWAASTAGIAKRLCLNPSCGAVLSDGQQFCTKCGTKWSEASAAVRICHSCGTALAKDALFCGSCGAKYLETESKNNIQNADSEKMPDQSEQKKLVRYLSASRKGDFVSFGHLPKSSRALEWVVLDRYKDSILLLSRYILASKNFSSSDKFPTWERSFLRSWLNETFIIEAFNVSERSLCELSNVKTEDNSFWWTEEGADSLYCMQVYGGKTANDYLFCLSYQEIKKYFSSPDAAIAPKLYSGMSSSYWLRSPGRINSSAACINGFGALCSLNAADSEGVRPALKLKLHI